MGTGKILAIVCLSAYLALFPASSVFARHGMGGHLSYFSTALFSDARNCAGCHNFLSDSTGLDVSIFNDWGSTMMAQAARDPLWRAKAHSEVLRNPAVAGVIEERCARCHTPMASVETKIFEGEPGLFRNGFLSPRNPLYPLAIDGVSCTLCHQIQAGGLGEQESFTGNFRVDEQTRRPFRPLFGPYADSFSMPMTRMSGFTPAYGGQSLSSELCASCHTLYVPFTDKEGHVMGEMPEQTPYLEWKHSAFGDGRNHDDLSCQQCHMPEAYGPAVISNRPRHLLPRAHFARHLFTGGNVFVLSMLKEHRQGLGIEASPEQLDTTLARTFRRLQARTAKISIEKITRNGESMEISVRVSNLAGHKFPTGIPMRRAWIHLTVLDSNGNALFESGKPEPDGSIRGNDNDADISTFEPHYTVIDSPEKVQIYETIMRDTEGAVTYTFTRCAEHIKENRLLPVGFKKEAAHADIKPHGEAQSDADFLGGSDRIAYVVNTGKSEGRLTVHAELLFQPVAFSFIQDLLAFSSRSAHVRRLDGYYRAADKDPVPISISETLLP